MLDIDSVEPIPKGVTILDNIYKSDRFIKVKGNNNSDYYYLRKRKNSIGKQIISIAIIQTSLNKL